MATSSPVPPPLLREGPYDRAVWQSVFVENEYGVPDDMAGMTVLDVGACFGAFTLLCLSRGARVAAFEPDPESYVLLAENVDRAGFADRCVLTSCAVLDREATLSLSGCDDPAGRTLFHRGRGVAVRVAPFDAACTWAAAQVSPATGRFDLVKIDAEGAEYPICEKYDFRGVRSLAVEFHDNYVFRARERALACRERLASLGFVEKAWETTHADHGWYRLYRGVRE